MILTVTPNPAIDYTVQVDTVRLGRRHVYRSPRLDPSGKGINVSRMAHRLGEPTLATGFVAGEMGAFLDRALGEEGVPHEFVRVDGQTRISVTVLADDSGATHFHGPGPRVGASDLARLAERVDDKLKDARAFVLSGSLPPGMPPEFCRDLVALARSRKVLAVLDADGEALRLGLGAKPSLVKPNREEAERLLGRPLRELRDVARAALELTDRGAEAALVSLGGEGAVLAREGGFWHAVAPRVPLAQAVGAGDSLVAGYVVAVVRGQSADALRFGTAASASTARTPGTGLGSAEEVRELLPRVNVTPLAV
jgi:1-phosphofructokinase family hexose kinase